MRKLLTRFLLLVGFGVLVTVITLWVSPRAQFLAGGAMVNVGYRLQDTLEEFDLEHHAQLTADEVWAEVLRKNSLVADVRGRFPRTWHHPLVAILACMDARIDTLELAGDTRHYYYTLRTAGSVMSDHEQEMLELAVNNGVKVVLLTTHSDCAAEKAAADPAARERYPNLVAALAERQANVQQFLKRPAIAAKIASGELLVKQMHIDTRNEGLTPSAGRSPAPLAHPSHALVPAALH